MKSVTSAVYAEWWKTAVVVLSVVASLTLLAWKVTFTANRISWKSSWRKVRGRCMCLWSDVCCTVHVFSQSLSYFDVLSFQGHVCACYVRLEHSDWFCQHHYKLNSQLCRVALYLVQKWNGIINRRELKYLLIMLVRQHWAVVVSITAAYLLYLGVRTASQIVQF